MSTYSLELPDQLDYVSVVEYAKVYTRWKNAASSTTEVDDDDTAVTGRELHDILRIVKFLMASAFRTASIMDVIRMLWEITEFTPETEGQAKFIVLDKL